MVKAVRSQCEHSPAQPPSGKHQIFCSNVVFGSKFCLEISLLSPPLRGSAERRQQLQKLRRRTQNFGSLSVGDSTPESEAPISRLPFQRWEAADVFVFNYFPLLHSLCFLAYVNTALLTACAQLPICHFCCLMCRGNLCAPSLLRIDIY